MTEFFRRRTASAVLWWPVLFRGFLYVAIAFVTAALSELDGLSPEQWQNMSWLDWLRSSLTVAGACLLTLRTFVDQSASQHAIKIASNENPVITLGSPVV